MRARLLAERGLSAGASTLCRFFQQRAITFKKSAYAADQDRTDVRAEHEAWFEGQPDLDPERLVFIDETGASTKMARLRGRARKGERLRAGMIQAYAELRTQEGGADLGGKLLHATGIFAETLAELTVRAALVAAEVNQLVNEGRVVGLLRRADRAASEGCAFRHGDGVTHAVIERPVAAMARRAAQKSVRLSAPGFVRVPRLCAG